VVLLDDFVVTFMIIIPIVIFFTPRIIFLYSFSYIVDLIILLNFFFLVISEKFIVVF